MKTPMADNASRSIVLHPWRLGAALLIVLVVLGRIALQLADVQLLDRKGYAQKANTEINRSILLTPSRGTIYDRMGNILALDVEEQSLYVEPQEIKPENAARLAVTLGAILDVPSEEVLAKLLDTSRRGVLVKRWLKPDVIQKITILNEKGVYLPYESHRAYPQGEFAAHVIGATNSTGMGIAGVEANFDDFLRGTTGVITTEVDGDGVPIWSRQYTKIAPKNGNVLILTIDSYIQHMVEVALSQAIEQHGATGGSAIVLDVKTGAVLAMASYPDFDPNNYADVDPAVYNINPAVGAVYEPGSTFKMVTVAAGLQAKAFDEKTQVEDNGTIRRFEET
ncbi:MAG: penicillin-binding protein 2, partial [Chloroflexia bacterium]|nr:penicillin-binding protein 2 [Chloroflexia bacterium]